MNKPPATEREHNTVTYMALKDDLKKLNEIARSDAPDAMERYTALSDEITAKYQSPEDASEIADFLLNGYKELGQEAEEMINYVTVKQQIAPYADIIPLGYIAKKYFGKKPGESVYDPVFVLASVLDWAGIAHNQRGYIQLSANFNR